MIILFYLQRYTFLTINQAEVCLDRRRSYQAVARRLRAMSDAKLIGSFGGHKVGYENVPKVYYIRKPGYKILSDSIPSEYLGPYVSKSKPGWTTKTHHRICLIDAFLSMEAGVRTRDRLGLVEIFLEYRRMKVKNKTVSATTDYISGLKIENTMIVPDGAFILESSATGNRNLYFLEMDMASEGIIAKLTKDKDARIYSKIQKYDKYLVSMKYRRKYKFWGDFDCFTLLFITTTENRVENIRKKLFDLPEEYHKYYLFNTYDKVCKDFFNKEWKVRSDTD